MYAVEKLSSYITRGVYTVSGPFHPFGGAVDIIVVQQQDGTFKSSPWYVRFGKFQGVLKTKEKVVAIAVNGKEKVVAIAVNGTEAGFHMYLDHKGEAYFLKEAGDVDGESVDTSPSSTSGDETDGKSSGTRITKTQSCKVEAGRSSDLKEVDGQMVVGTNSRRSGILGMMFGRRSIKESSGGDVQRASSLERAEIAADLLDTKWSTNLPARGDDRMVSSHGKPDDNLAVSAATEDHFEEVNAHNSESLGVDEEVQDVASSDQMTLELGNVNGHSLSSLGAVDGIQDVSSSHVNALEIGESSHTGLKGEVCEELVGLQEEHLDDSLRTSVISEVHIEEKIIESSGERTLEEVIEITTLEADDLTGESGLIYETVMTESKEFEVSPEGPILKNASFNVRSHGTSPKSRDSEQAFHESYDASVVEKGGKEVFTLSYSLSANDAQEALNPPFCPSKQFEHQGEVSCTEVSSEVKLQPESSQHDDNGNVDACPPLNSKISTTENSFFLNKPQSSWRSNEVFEDAMTNDFCFDSPVIGSEHTLTGSCSSHNPDLICSESKVPCHEGETLNSAEENKLSLEPIAFHVNQPEMIGSPVTSLNTLILTPKSVQPLHSNDSEIPDFSDQVQETANLGKGYEGKKFCLSKGDDFAQKLDSNSCSAETMKTRVPSSESIEDDQFLLDDIGGFDAEGTNAKQFSNDSAGNADNRRLLTSDCDMKTVHDELSSENKYETLGTQTSPMIIPRNHTHLAESELLIRSLPIIRSHVHDLEPSNLLHPLSCSLNINSTRNKHSFLEHEMSNSSVLEVDSESNMLDGHHLSKSATAIDPEKWGDQRGTSINPDVELSLCRHLLFEGMGADAASQAFNAEKAQIFEPQGMIAVDGPGNLLNGGAMGEMVPSGGSWRLWPFTFRKSKTITTVRSTREGTIVANVDTASEGTKNSNGNSGAQKIKTAKKREQSLTPTSEELDSLNLKEGSNEITFTFSTAMLGRQQVDCRIYLWKWNTRIVISDVDGTITKSDVLGQFMPLVGVDWSQTGVTHLFSAIKENGYQLLFLSARAISQAYITRQFLFNLKQDGKALPVGPVVISPDGLFPSLYREVIRRAPHEFKISCLEDIKALFPRDCSPFYAGFGNRDTDEISYLKVGIPKGKIFIINPKGQVAVNRRVATKSYSSLHALVNGMFPPMSSAEQEDFNSWNYWKLPLPDIDV